MASIDTIADRSTGSAVAGKAYFETSTNKFIVYNGSSWVEIDSDGTGSAYMNEYAVLFDGTNDYMTLSGLSSCYAFSCWIKPDSTITSSGNAGNLLGANSTSWFGGLGSVTGDFTNELITVRPYSQGGFAYTSSSDSIPSGSWTHIAIRWEASNSQTNPGNAGYDIFKNGIKVGNAAGSAAISSPLTFSTGIIGARQTAYALFNGKIDEVAFWASSVSESDIATMYNSGVPGDLTSLSPYGWWRMGDGDDGSGNPDGTLVGGNPQVYNMATDSSGNRITGNDGALINGPTFSSDVPS